MVCIILDCELLLLVDSLCIVPRWWTSKDILPARWRSSSSIRSNGIMTLAVGDALDPSVTTTNNKYCSSWPSVVVLAICKGSCGQVSVSGMSGCYVLCRVGIDWIPRKGVMGMGRIVRENTQYIPFILLFHNHLGETPTQQRWKSPAMNAYHR